ncbi:MAG: GMC family oxidoreductase N-terminal domain-containing protein [Vicinamibacterales bacterium]
MERRDFLRMGLASVVAAEGVAQAAPAPGSRTGRAQPAQDADYVIVGGGSSGCVLANRLSADQGVRVVLLDAGVSGESDPAVTTPGRWVSLLGSSYDWQYRTQPETGLGGREIAFPRGKALGGSSAINAMAHIRGHRLCFDRWRDLGNPGWGYDEVLPLFKRSERNESGASEYRGGDGPLAVSFCWDPHDGHRAFLTGAIHAGYRADARFDFNEPNPVAVAGYYQKNILDGRRHSAAAAFLVPAMDRTNLEVRTGARATRLLVEGRRVTGVTCVRDGRTETVRATREVILCGGVIDSPKLLMLSGIGPADHLRAHGIPVVADVPGVGGNLQDHLKLSIRWQGLTELPGSTVTAGLFTVSQSRFPPDLQFYVGRGLDQPDRFITITVSLVRPESRGEVRLASADRRPRPHHLRLPRGAGRSRGARARRPARPPHRRVQRLREAAGCGDRARARRTHHGRSGGIRAPCGRHHLPRCGHVPDGSRQRPVGGGRPHAGRPRRRGPACGGRVDHARGGERHHPRGLRDDRREGRRSARRPRRRLITAASGCASWRGHHSPPRYATGSPRPAQGPSPGGRLPGGGLPGTSMYGLINSAVEDMVCGRFGAETWAAVKARAEVQTEGFIALQTYPDELTYRLVTAAAAELHLPVATVLERFGEFWVLETGRSRYGHVMRMYGSTLFGFLENLDQMHSRLGLTFREMQPPSFDCVREDERTMAVHYHSTRDGLLPFVVGLLKGLATLFHAPAQVEVVASKADGAAHDVLRVRLDP